MSSGGVAVVVSGGMAALLLAMAPDPGGPSLPGASSVPGASAMTGSPAPATMEGPDEATTPNRVCLDGLREHQISFIEWPTKGIRTPVRVSGPIGAVRFRTRDRHATDATPLMDCELARALLDAAPAFRGLGVRVLLFSGTYQYRTRRRSTKLSEHAHGLAIDVHAFALDADAGDGAVVDVERDFEAQVGTWAVTDQNSCIGHPVTSADRLLRTLACRLRASSVFREVITPDDNADHYNHFHLEAFPDALSRTRAVLSHRPAVIDD